MKDLLITLLHLAVMTATLCGRGGVRAVSVEIGLRHDGGDAETGAGLVMTDASTGLAVDLRVRTLVLHQADGFSERGVSLSLSYDPTPSTPLGLTANVAPSWGRAGHQRRRGPVGPRDNGGAGAERRRRRHPA